MNIIKSDTINDVDIVLLDPALWEKFSQQYKVIDVPYGKAIRLGRAFPNPWKIEFLNCIGPEKFQYMIREGIVSNGINFITLENLITFKELFDRPEDRIHIELIKKYLLMQKKER